VDKIETIIDFYIKRRMISNYVKFTTRSTRLVPRYET